MKIKKRLVTALSVFVGLALAVGIWAVASTSYGSQSDPLITLSYLTDVLTGQITEKVNTMIDTKLSELSDELNTRITALENQSGGSGSFSKFSVVSIAGGQTLTGEVGTELMLRVGTALCYASGSPGLIDTTTAGTLENNGSMVTNHMYMVTISGRGIKATSNVMVLVRGEYTVS
ncbi:MAG: hypothetical protein GX111_01600 [Clostridiales bacterium]|nr:hypothetical protein [Clostridiales bacterium]